MRYFFDTDNDAHTYLVEADHRKEWEEWVNLDQDDERAWEPPSFARPLGMAVSQFTFVDPQEVD